MCQNHEWFLLIIFQIFKIYGQVFAEDAEDHGHLPTQTLKVRIKIKSAGIKEAFSMNNTFGAECWVFTALGDDYIVPVWPWRFVTRSTGESIVKMREG